MCGVLLQVGNLKSEDDFKFQLENLSHRGPDNLGIYFDKINQLALGHTLLSIQGDGEVTYQPSFDKSKRFCIIYNGEIYNHLELRRSFDLDINNESNSDTETIIELISKIGIVETIKNIDGMYALVIFDSVEKKVYLTRDRYGEKPLFYFHNKEETYIIASSEKEVLFKILKSFNYKFQIHYENSYIQDGFLRDKKNFLIKGLKQVNPSELVVYDMKNNILTTKSIIKIFDSYSEDIKTAKDNLHMKNSFKSSLNKTLIKMVNNSNHPISLFFSGGIDSTLILSSLVKLKERNLLKNEINCLHVSFEDQSFSETEFAEKICEELKIPLKKIMLDSFKIKESAKYLLKNMSNLIADPAMIPLLAMCKEFKDIGGKVAISGDGADELFLGYNRHKYISFFANLGNRRRRISNLFLDLNLFKNALYKYDSLRSKSFFSNFPYLPCNLGEKYLSLTKLLSLKSQFKEIYLNNLYQKANDSWASKNSKIDVYNKIREEEILNYLPNNILLKSDLASMLFSIEVRSPFLSSEIANFNRNFKNKIKNKDILKETILDLYPKYPKRRPKRGFGVPLVRLLSEELSEEIDTLFSLKTNASYILNKASKGIYKNQISSLNNLWSRSQRNQSISKNIWAALCLHSFVERNF